MTGNDLEKALTGLADGHRDRAPVFRIAAQSREAAVREAFSLGGVFWGVFGDCSPRTDLNGVVAVARLANDGSMRIFPSGAIDAAMFPPESRKPIASEEKGFDRNTLNSRLHEAAHNIAKLRIASNEELRFESLWEHKGQTVTVRGAEKSPVALLSVVAAFRRHVHGLPVFGRASVHVGLGGGSIINRWGIDWRRVDPKPFAETAIVSPAEGAKRVMDDLWWRRPERDLTTEDFEPRTFRLGYLAHSRRAEQQVLQPVWLAVLKPRRGFSMGHIIAVPASPRPFEPISRPARTPCLAVATPA